MQRKLKPGMIKFRCTGVGRKYVGCAYLVHSTAKFALLTVDMRLKRAVVIASACSYPGGSTIPRNSGVWLGAGEDSFYKGAKVGKNDVKPFFLSFPDFAVGWHLWAVDGPTRYTLRLVFSKEA